jgi:hypothetical protein
VDTIILLEQGGKQGIKFFFNKVEAEKILELITFLAMQALSYPGRATSNYGENAA